jgi:adenosylcobinamide-phosphate synthase
MLSILSQPGEVTPFAVVLLALAIDAAIGDPRWLYRRLPHPAALLGRVVAALERALNRPAMGTGARRAGGVFTIVAVVACAGTVAWLLASITRSFAFGWVVEAALASTLLAQRGLYDHVAAVARALEGQGLAAGRQAVAHIVGRDPATLDEAAVSRAAIESCAENFCDGVVAPVFWYALLGLPGLAAYKAINTADSMVGHRDPAHAAFGWAAARLDDLVNLVPARLGAALIALAAAPRRGDLHAAFGAMVRDAPHHRSPNAGWPEAAMAGALGLRLAGPRRYGDRVVDDAWMGDGRAVATPADIRAALGLLVAACALLWALLAALAVVHQLG